MILFCSTARQSLCVLFSISDSSVLFDFTCIIASERSSVYLHRVGAMNLSLMHSIVEIHFSTVYCSALPTMV